MILSAVAVLITFGLVIFLHEFGHFLVCRRLGVRVERFAFGFGPELLGITAGETRFSICAVPLGGYVKPAGESLDDATGQPDEYFSQSPWRRLMIVAAGPTMNYILAFVMFFCVVFFRGMPEPSKDAVIGDMAPDFPAKVAGLQSGDRIIRVGGMEVKQWSDMAEYIHRSPNKAVEVEFLREGKSTKTTLTPALDSASGKGLIGIMPQVQYRNVGFLESNLEAAHQCWYWTAYTVNTLAEKIYHREKPDLAGPVGIVQMVSKAAHSGLEDLVFLIGLISVAIGFFNLLPVPLLDGGHAVLYIWEGISHRKLTVKIMTAMNSAGLVLLLSLLLFATYNDVLRIRDQRREEKKKAKAVAEEVAPKTEVPLSPVPAK
ncbi:MAG TPA: RIP metalloprotease RseP [Elusimicrobia bacterium]|nr:RIP metalloprotease RseP [Elusimicrobiota bacterium]